MIAKRWFPAALLAAGLALALGACSRAARSPVILTVDGEPVTKSDFEQQYAYELSFREIRQEGQASAHPMARTEEEIKEEIFRRMLIPMAAVKAHYRDKIPLLLKEARDIRKKVAPDASNFAALAAEYSKDSNAAEGGSWRTVTRYALYYPVNRYVFTAKLGEVSDPILSLVGCHLVLVQSRGQGMLATDDTAVASHILLPYEDDRPDFLPVMVDELVRKARIEVKDPAYAAYVPERGENFTCF